MMSPARWFGPVRYLVQKEFRQIFRDPAMLRIIFFVPVIQLLVLSYAANLDLKNIRLAVLDEDRTASSRSLIESFFQNPVFVSTETAHAPRELDEMIWHGRADMTLWIPPGFAEDLTDGSTATVGIAVDGVNSSAAARSLGYAEGVIRQEVRRLNDAKLRAHPEIRIHQVVAHSRFFYNPELESRYYMVPAILVLLITIISGMMTGMAVVREKEIGTFEQLMVTPLTPGQIIAGKLIPFGALSFATLILSGTIAVLWFGVPLEGSLLLLALSALIYLVVTLGGGLLASTVSRTQQQAMFTVWFFLIFGIMTSGFFYPIENMPRAIQWMTFVNPIRFLMEIVRGIFLKGSGLWDIMPNLWYLTGMAVVVFTIAVSRFRKRLT